ncbi:protein-L-isoaspartate O-methyltransferase [Patescibacteria group bacterium]|nr:protein-L-isoaspartate O-methyltransferase [Patescibacteria group bacterium]
MNTKKNLIEHLEENTQVFKRKEFADAFEHIDRVDFVIDDCKVEAYEDYPLPIAKEQSISQPTTVAFMLELLSPERGEKILDVGSGSGWTTAIIAHIIGEKGYVWGVELLPDLVSFGRKNISKYHFKNAEILQAGDILGLPHEAPFDKILVSACADNIPQELMEQLKEGGIMVLPIGDSICKVEKKSDGVEIKHYPGFAFVPLITK